MSRADACQQCLEERNHGGNGCRKSFVIFQTEYYHFFLLSCCPFFPLLQHWGCCVFRTLQMAKVLGNKTLHHGVLEMQMHLLWLDAVAHICNPSGGWGGKIAASSTPTWATAQHKNQSRCCVGSKRQSDNKWAALGPYSLPQFQCLGLTFLPHPLSTKHIWLSPPSSRHCQLGCLLRLASEFPD